MRQFSTPAISPWAALDANNFATWAMGQEAFRKELAGAVPTAMSERRAIVSAEKVGDASFRVRVEIGSLFHAGNTRHVDVVAELSGSMKSPSITLKSAEPTNHDYLRAAPAAPTPIGPHQMDGAERLIAEQVAANPHQFFMLSMSDRIDSVVVRARPDGTFDAQANVVDLFTAQARGLRRARVDADGNRVQ